MLPATQRMVEAKYEMRVEEEAQEKLDESWETWSGGEAEVPFAFFILRRRQRKIWKCRRKEN